MPHGDAQALALRGWTGAALIPVVTQALGGIVVGLVTKRLGGISKGFAIVGGLVLTGGLQSALEGRLLSAELYAALALVMCRCARFTRGCLSATASDAKPVFWQHVAAWSLRREGQGAMNSRWLPLSSSGLPWMRGVMVHLGCAA